MSSGVDRSDAELWASSTGGEAEAFGQLFERHDRAVYNHVFRRTGDWSAAEDVTSLVFLEAWRRRESVQLTGESSLPWLLGVANYVLLNRWRSRRRHRAALARLPREHSEDFADDSDERIDVDRRFFRVVELLGKLPEGDRVVLELVAWDQLDYQSAATALGVPVGTVRSRLSRARRRLSALEDRENGSDGVGESQVSHHNNPVNDEEVIP